MFFEKDISKSSDKLKPFIKSESTSCIDKNIDADGFFIQKVLKSREKNEVIIELQEELEGLKSHLDFQVILIESTSLRYIP